MANEVLKAFMSRIAQGGLLQDLQAGMQIARMRSESAQKEKELALKAQQQALAEKKFGISERGMRLKEEYAPKNYSIAEGRNKNAADRINLDTRIYDEGPGRADAAHQRAIDLVNRRKAKDLTSSVGVTPGMTPEEALRLDSEAMKRAEIHEGSKARQRSSATAAVTLHRKQQEKELMDQGKIAKQGVDTEGRMNAALMGLYKDKAKARVAEDPDQLDAAYQQAEQQIRSLRQGIRQRPDIVEKVKARARQIFQEVPDITPAQAMDMAERELTGQ